MVFCTGCRFAGTLKVTALKNNKKNGGRLYFACPSGCLERWGDDIGVYPDNLRYYCWKLGRLVKFSDNRRHFECAKKNCGFQKLIS
jgi:hypothetical protein